MITKLSATELAERVATYDAQLEMDLEMWRALSREQQEAHVMIEDRWRRRDADIAAHVEHLRFERWLAKTSRKELERYAARFRSELAAAEAAQREGFDTYRARMLRQIADVNAAAAAKAKPFWGLPVESEPANT